VSGDLVFVAGGERRSVSIIDAKAPGSASLLTELEVPSAVIDVAVSARCIIAAGGDAGFSIIGE
jgi:hypothetical protein